MIMKFDIKSLLLPEIDEFILSIGEKQFRAQQIFSWLHSGVKSFDEMTNLPKELRNTLDKTFFISVPEIIEKQVSGIDGTIKYLWRVQENDLVECVLMEYSHGNTICISSQIGCKMGCLLCASSLNGFKRDLAASEMLDQVLFTQIDSGKRISNIVLMGIGEPLDNFDNLMRFIELICHPKGVNIGARHITVSTCGVIENIDKLADYDVQLTLAISLHAPDDETRSRLIPVNSKTGVKRLLEAGSNYFKKTGRRISYEYALIEGVNDSPDQAKQLSKLLRNTKSHLNLILLSNVKERQFTSSSAKNADMFIDILKENGVSYTMRRSLGADIDASCGQLRNRILNSRTYKE